jgi:indole-3-glycerol phosphate synthase
LGLLDRIVATKQEEVGNLRPRAAELRRLAAAAPVSPDFAKALRSARFASVGVIAEVKRRSPSAGAIREAADPVATARAYAAGGAAAISVLTDAEYFGGSIDDLRNVAHAVEVPVLRKDFIIDELQIAEARAAGASAVLLIVRLLDVAMLRSLREYSESLGMAALVEAHNEAECDVALNSGATIIGVNNRDLDALTIDLAVCDVLLRRIPRDCIAIAESGIRTTADVERMAAAGADAVLVGEALMRDGDAESGARALSGVARMARG